MSANTSRVGLGKCAGTAAECWTYDLEGVGHNADGHELLAVVAAVHHERVGEALNDWALCFAETLDRVPACGVGDVDRLSDLDVVAVGESMLAVCGALIAGTAVHVGTTLALPTGGRRT